MKQSLQIRDVVKLTGIDRETLRFYEKKGLLPEPDRTEAGYRVYDLSIIDRLRFIKFAQDVCFTLKEISELLNLGQNRPLLKADLQKIADQKIESIDSRIRALKSMRKLLVDLSRRTTRNATRLAKSSACPILSQFKNLEL